MIDAEFRTKACRIKAVGVGGGGCNAINRMMRAEIHGVDFVSVNSDAQALMSNEAPTRVQIGSRVCGGLGAGGDPVLGRQAAEESLDDLQQVVGGAHMVFIATGLGGGTGTGASPLIARLARDSGALTIAVVTTPFQFEMSSRARIAERGLEELKREVNAAIVIPNEHLLRMTGNKVTLDNAFKMADEVLMTSVRTISEVITVPGLINLDFADVSAVMEDAGACWLSIGHGSGQERVAEAARAAITSDFLGGSIDGASGVLFVISGSPSLTLSEVSRAATVVEAAVDRDAKVLFGVTVDPSLDDEVKVTLVATGFTPMDEVGSPELEEDYRAFVRELESDESRLEAPSFMRRRASTRRMAVRV